MARRKQDRLDKLLDNSVYLDVEHMLAALEARMARMSELNYTAPEELGLSEGTRQLMVSQHEAALAEMRWQLHSQVRHLIWTLRKL